MSPSKVPLLVEGSGPLPKRGCLHPRESVPKRHLDRFCHFAQVNRVFAKQRNSHTDKVQSTLRATSVAIGRIYALRACGAAIILNSFRRYLKTSLFLSIYQRTAHIEASRLSARLISIYDSDLYQH